MARVLDIEAGGKITGEWGMERPLKILKINSDIDLVHLLVKSNDRWYIISRISAISRSTIHSFEKRNSHLCKSV